MEGIYLYLTVRTCLTFLFLILLQTSAAVDLCTGPEDAMFAENNTIGYSIATITIQDGVKLTFSNDSPQPDGFILDGNQLKANKVFDRENGDKEYNALRITCSGSGGAEFPYFILVRCLNINDNKPKFKETTFNRNLPEMSPVGTKLGPFEATDLDDPKLHYTLKTSHSAFRLEDPARPNLIVETLLQYDKVKNVQLILEVVDTALVFDDPVYTASATININIVDVDNRPPWFEHCTEYEIDGALVCQSAGYTGSVVLNEQEEGALALKPGPIYAFDGDLGINEDVKYSFLGGDAGGLFAISETTGSITMTKPADVLGTISLTVLAAQRINVYQFSTTTVSISVQVKSLHSPKFQKTQYDGVFSSVGSLALDLTGEPLQILATDDDYSSNGGFNPHIVYAITGSHDFTLINGYLFMTKELPDSTLTLQVSAVDTSNDESATVPLSVEVKSGPTTTPPPTTDSRTTALTEEPTTNSKTTGTSVPTSDPSMTSEEASTAHPPTVSIPSGSYGPADMAALGATLGFLLFISIITITVLALQVQRGKSDWKKIYETSIFRSTLGQGSGGPKDSMQYTNDAFMNDEDGDDRSSGGLAGESLKNQGDFTPKEAIERSTASPPLHQGDDESLAESDKADNDKEVKPILTKERRTDDGYKSVWFKEDIDPDAKEEVVIIPDSREDESEGEEEDDSEEENKGDNPGLKATRVVFNDTDLDSGLGLKMEDPAEDSESSEMFTDDL